MFNALEVLQPTILEQSLDTLWSRISPLYSVDEEQWLTELLKLAEPSDTQLKASTDAATRLIEQVHGQREKFQAFCWDTIE